jgi:ethanolamine transporter
MKIKIQAVSGFLLTMANSIATFGMLKDMDDKGKMLNAAFSVGAAWVLGDHLGYTAQTKPLMLVPMIVAKLMAGITAVIVANLLYKIVQKKQK